MTDTDATSWAHRHRKGLWVLLGVLLYGIASGLTVRDAAADATTARDLLQARVDGEVGIELIDDETLRTDLATAEDRFASSHDQLRSAHLLPVRWLPVVGRQLESATALAAAGRDVSGSAHRTLSDLDQIRAEAPTDGAQRMDQIGALRDSVDELAQTLDGIDAGPSESLVGTLADARGRLTEEVGRLDEEVERASTILGGLHHFLTGPSTYLVLGANNAEMRSGSGTYLSIGELIVENGEFELLGFEPTRDFLPREGAGVVDLDVQDRWGFLDLTADWRRLNYSARFDDYTGPQAAAMWERTKGSRPDGVMVVDPLVLQAILRVVGAVEVEGDQIEADTVLQDLFFEQYTIGHNDPAFLELNEARSSRLSLIAGATVEALGQPGWEPLELIEALEPVADGRHLLMWGDDPAAQASWAELGVDGSIPADAIMVNVLNSTGSKLDPFIRVTSSISMVPTADGWDGQMVVELRNEVPVISDRYAYVLGAWEELGHERGAYGGRVVVTLPGSVSEARMDGRTLEVFGPDGDSFVLGTRVVVDPGSTETIVVDFVLQPSSSQITLVPSARIPAVSWVVGGNVLDDSASYTWRLDELFGLPDPSGSPDG